MKWIIIITSWIIVGMLSCIAMCVIDMRGKSYDEHFFDGMLSSVVLLIGMGYISPFILLIAAICTKTNIQKMQSYITHFLYNLANIGTSKNKQ